MIKIKENERESQYFSYISAKVTKAANDRVFRVTILDIALTGWLLLLPYSKGKNAFCTSFKKRRKRVLFLQECKRRQRLFASPPPPGEGRRRRKETTRDWNDASFFPLSLSLLFTAENSPFPFFSSGKYGRTFARYSSQLICFYDKQFINSYPNDNKLFLDKPFRAGFVLSHFSTWWYFFPAATKGFFFPFWRHHKVRA